MKQEAHHINNITNFSNYFWADNEIQYKSDNGGLIIGRLKNDNLSLIIANVYAPNDHNVNYFNQQNDLVLDIQTDNPTYSVIIAQVQVWVAPMPFQSCVGAIANSRPMGTGM